MRIARTQYNNEIWTVAVDASGETAELLTRDEGHADSTIALIERGPDINYKAGTNIRVEREMLLPPIRQPSKDVICVGKNYRAHADEFTRSGFDSSGSDVKDSIPAAPILFTKAACTMAGPYQDVLPPWQLTRKIDYEGELGLVIGRAGRSIAAGDAYSHIWGYTVINDVTARDLQLKHKQWLLGKSIDTFCPIGPWIVTADEVDPTNLQLDCWVNDELRQSANTSDLIFDIPTIIETASASMTLFPGDIIATGTPAGVGVGFDPPRYLQPGDVVRVSIGGIGTIENRIR